MYTIITSIYPPTRAVMAHAKKNYGKCIIVGDKKTSAKWKCDGAVFLPWEEHERFGLKGLPFNHYCRKMVGYLCAMEQGAEAIFDTDDDNFPYLTEHAFPGEKDRFLVTPPNLGFFNVYRYYTKQYIWPRGFPLRHVHAPFPEVSSFGEESVSVGVWQGLADGDPDVDAVHRLVTPGTCKFAQNGPLVLGQGTIAPFNSQNTLFFKDFFPLLYLPAFVTFRFTDILRGYVAQCILWTKNCRLGFTDASVYQERNEHDLMRDFEQEVPMFLQSEKAVDAVCKVTSSREGIADNLMTAYRSLYHEKIVVKEELDLLESWLKQF